MLHGCKPGLWSCFRSMSHPYTSGNPEIGLATRLMSHPHTISDTEKLICCRLGRILCRMDASQDFGIGSSFAPKIAFLLATLNTACPGCQPNYLVLAMCMSSTMLIGTASRLLQPMSQSTGDDVTMQVRTALHTVLFSDQEVLMQTSRARTVCMTLCGPCHSCVMLRAVNSRDTRP